MHIIDKIKYRIAQKNSNSYVDYLRKKGCTIGKNVHFHDTRNVFMDLGKLDFIKIGDNCNITRGVVILGHDYSYKVFRNVYHDMPQKSASTVIGNNVFIGMNAIILMGAEIGDNVVIGAGSVVSGKIPNNSVVGGNPAKVICSLDKYHEKCLNNFEENAKRHALTIINNKKRKPTIEEMGYFSVLFLDKTIDNRKKYFDRMSITGDCQQEVIDDLMHYENKYSSFDDFIKELNIKL